MPIPDFETIMLPLLKFAENGQECSVESAEKYLAKYFDLTEMERKTPKPSGPEPIFLNRLRWARLFLKKAGLLTDPRKSFYQITPAGKETLEKDPKKINISFLKQYDLFIKWYSRKKPKKILLKPKLWKSIKKSKIFNEYSKSFQTILLSIENTHLNRQQNNLNDIKKLQLQLKEAKHVNLKKDLSLELEKSIEKFQLAYTNWEGEEISILSKVDESFKQKFEECSKQDIFYDEAYLIEYSQRYFPLLEFDIDIKKIYDSIKEDVLANGQLSFNFDEHSALLKFYVNYLPTSEVTKKVINYWLNNWKDIPKSPFFYIQTIAFGLEALIDYDSKKYHDEIQEHKQFLLRHQSTDGSFSFDKKGEIEGTGYCLIALSKILPYDDAILKKGEIFLRKQISKENLKWRNSCAAALALMALGDGPKVPKTWFEEEQRKTKQFLRQKSTNFVFTSPSTNTQKIRDTISTMIQETNSELYIISPFIDMYSEILDVVNVNPKINIKIISRPLSEFKGDRQRFAKAAYDALRVLPNIEFKISTIIHSRMILSDSKKLLVSSADLTHAQLYDEFNAGLYAEEIDSVYDAKTFFESILQTCDSVSKK